MKNQENNPTHLLFQGAASALLASLEKEKELLRIFLRVSQMENAILRRMNLSSFLMVSSKTVTKHYRKGLPRTWRTQYIGQSRLSFTG